jgi:hypothetical protein
MAQQCPPTVILSEAKDPCSSHFDGPCAQRREVTAEILRFAQDDTET